MKEFLLTATYLVGAGELLLAAYFWKTNSGNEIRRVMALFSGSIAMWVICSALVSYKSPTTFLSFISSLVYVFGIFLITSLLHLVMVFPYPYRIFDFLHKLLLYIPALIFSAISLTTNSIESSFNATPSFAGYAVRGEVYPIYNIYLLSLYLFAVFILWSRLKKFDGIHLLNARVLLFGITIGGLPAVFIDLIFPILAPSLRINYLFGNLFTGVWLGFVLFAINRKK